MPSVTRGARRHCSGGRACGHAGHAFLVRWSYLVCALVRQNEYLFPTTPLDRNPLPHTWSQYLALLSGVMLPHNTCSREATACA